MSAWAARTPALRRRIAARPRHDDDQVGSRHEARLQRGLHVEETRTQTSVPAAPDPARVHELADHAMQAIKAAQQQVISDARELEDQRSNLDARRNALEAKQSEIEKQREVCEVRLRELQTFQSDLESQRVELRKTLAGIDAERSTLEQQARDLEARNAQIERQRLEQAAVAQSLAEREHDVATAEQRLAASTQSLEQQRLQLQQKETEIARRVDFIEAEAAELESARDAILSLQQQLDRDHETIVGQREELLRRLAATPISKPGPRGSQPPAPVEPEPVATAANGPKPGASVDQFRKLRRDAKRKALGV